MSHLFDFDLFSLPDGDHRVPINIPAKYIVMMIYGNDCNDDLFETVTKSIPLLYNYINYNNNAYCIKKYLNNFLYAARRHVPGNKILSFGDDLQYRRQIYASPTTAESNGYSSIVPIDCDKLNYHYAVIDNLFKRDISGINDILSMSNAFKKRNVIVIEGTDYKYKDIFTHKFKPVITEHLKTNDGIIKLDKLIKRAFDNLCAELAVDVAYNTLTKKNNIPMDENSNYVIKLSDINEYFTREIINSDVYFMVKPYTKGTVVYYDYPNCYKGIHVNNTFKCRDAIKSYGHNPNRPINKYNTAIILFNKYTHKIFKIPMKDVFITGSLISYCICPYINKSTYRNSDIDMFVNKQEQLINVGSRLMKRLRTRSLNNVYKIIKCVSSKVSDKIVINMISYMYDRNELLTYDSVSSFSANDTNIYKPHLSLITKSILHKITTDDNVVRTIQDFIDGRNNIPRKITYSNITILSCKGKYKCIRDIDLYVNNESVIANHHESIVRAYIKDNDFYIFADCLNTVFTSVSQNYYTCVGKAEPIDVMYKKQSQCISGRMCHGLYSVYNTMSMSMIYYQIIRNARPAVVVAGYDSYITDILAKIRRYISNGEGTYTLSWLGGNFILKNVR